MGRWKGQGLRPFSYTVYPKWTRGSKNRFYSNKTFSVSKIEKNFVYKKKTEKLKIDWHFPLPSLPLHICLRLLFHLLTFQWKLGGSFHFHNWLQYFYLFLIYLLFLFNLNSQICLCCHCLETDENSSCQSLAFLKLLFP